MNEPLWIDCDMGFDDLAAILMVRASDREVAGLSLVAGNAGLPQVVSNAMACRTLFGWDFPIHAGAAEALNGSRTDAAYVLGATGMPTAGRKLPACADAPDGYYAVDALAVWLDTGGRQVLALGPLTNIALLLNARPDLAAQMEVTWMGGSATTGNHTATAEFNAFADPEAVAAVIASGVPIRMVGLDCCRQVTITAADGRALRAMPGERAALLADLLTGYACIRDAAGEAPMPLFDPVAAAAVIEPKTVTFAPARLDCELYGALTRGMTVVEWRQNRAAPNALIATKARVARTRKLFLDGLAAAAAPDAAPDAGTATGEDQ